jgi:hypothetical protein
MEIDAEGNHLRRQARALPAGPNDLVGGGRAFLRGIPMAGEYLDEGFAAFDATFGGDRSQGWGDRWNSAVEEQRAYDADFDRRNPMASVLLRTAGGAIMPGGPMVGAGVKLIGAAARLPKAGASLQWVGGRLMPPRPQLGSQVAAEAAKGAVDGVVDGFGGGQGGFAERLHHAGEHAIRSAAWGAGTPLAGKGFAGMAHDGGKVRDAAKTARRVEGLLGRLEANGPIAGVLPLPYQAY